MTDLAERFAVLSGAVLGEHALAVSNRFRMVGSIGRGGAAADNAAMESFFSLLQRNILGRRQQATREELRIAIMTGIERT